ncbi:F-type H+-transporting ATPase subunit epsilon [Bacilli bacterium PM5-3]|nr:F-type H+-transporting ATPase subunit epsilon [Bacilli bacterium PM5-3]MDH6603992.1 F-type H+-transporting ATPase subunit epsilon [Bacilli bacterium PM5-9]
MFKLTIASPEEIVYEGNVEILNVYTLNGQVGILENHAPFTDIIKSCEMTFKDETGEVKKMAVSGGWLFVWTKEVTVFVNSSEYDFAIDVTKALIDKEEAEKALSDPNKMDMIQMARTRAKFDKAVNRIRVADSKIKK